MAKGSKNVFPLFRIITQITLLVIIINIIFSVFIIRLSVQLGEFRRCKDLLDLTHNGVLLWTVKCCN
jgi:hypothetical protein